MPKILSLAWETILEIEHTFEDKHCQPEDTLELFRRHHNDVRNIHEELAVYINTPSWDRPTICYNDDGEEYTIAITPILSTEDPDNSLSTGGEHLDTIPETELSELIKSSVENLDFSESNDDSTSIDDDSFSMDDIEYVEASHPDSELVSLEVMEIVIPEVGGIDEDILLTIKDDILREKLLNINLLIANIEELKDNPTPYSNFMTKSSSISLNFFLEETNTFDNYLPESETFCFDSEENSSGNTTTRVDISFLDYEAFYDNHVKEISSSSTTTHYDFSLYDSFIFDLSINPFLPANVTSYLLQIAPQYLLSFGNEDIIFDPGISICHSFMSDVSHQSGTFIKLNVYPKHLNESPMEILFSTCSPWTIEFRELGQAKRPKQALHILGLRRLMLKDLVLQSLVL
uniref:Reverse transcriptase domain-containing protein n=1 Tax=Tanacetum cinerariifolium TaxID=118510 RepID=A0A699IDS6_TANCI|nr:hypothetical protein [Tanacetum cinerariifolium]GEZ55334.1 hypothetical protein [Tanacetum cinerariifolium]